MPQKGRPRKNVVKQSTDDILTLMEKARSRQNSPIPITPEDITPILVTESEDFLVGSTAVEQVLEKTTKKRGRPKKNGDTTTSATKGISKTPPKSIKSPKKKVHDITDSLIVDLDNESISPDNNISVEANITPKNRSLKRNTKEITGIEAESMEESSGSTSGSFRKSRYHTPQIHDKDSDDDILNNSRGDIYESDGEFKIDEGEAEIEDDHDDFDEPMAIADEVLELNSEIHDEEDESTIIEGQQQPKPKETRGRKKGVKNKSKNTDAPSFRKTSSYAQGLEIRKITPDQLSIQEADEVVSRYFNSGSPFAKPKLYSQKNGFKKFKLTSDMRTLQFHGFAKYFKKKLSILDSTVYSDYYNFNEDAFKHIELNNLDELPKVQDAQYMPVSKQQFEIDLPLINKLTLTIDSKINKSTESTESVENEIPLQGNFKPVPFFKPENHRSGFVFNCGGLPLVTTWLDKTIAGCKKYLLVSVYSHGLHFEKPSDLSVVKLNKLAISYKDAFNSGLFIYEYDMNKQTLNLNKKLYFNKGSIVRMKWLPCTDPSLDENLLACVFQDGSAGIIKVNSKLLEKTDHSYYKLIRCSVDIKIPEFEIFSIDWTSNTNVICGLNNGFIAEFNIKSPENPLYIHSLELGTIHHISTCFSNKIFCEDDDPLSNVALVSSNNFSTLLIDLNDLTLQGQTYRDKVLVKQGEYSALLNSFIYEDQQDKIRILTVRESSIRDSFSTMEEPLNSIGISDYSHLILTGHVNGAVRLINYFRRALIPSKSSQKAHSTLRILKMTRVFLKNENKFNLNLNFKIDLKGDDENDNVNNNAAHVNPTINLNDDSISVLSCTLNNEPNLPGLMACSFANGLIVVEKLATARSEFKD